MSRDEPEAERPAGGDEPARERAPRDDPARERAPRDEPARAGASVDEPVRSAAPVEEPAPVKPGPAPAQARTEPAQPGPDPAQPGTEPRGRRTSPNMLPARDQRGIFERTFVRLIATGGIVGIGVAIAAIMTSSDSQGWLIGLVVSVVSVVLAALLWSSRIL
ncbi:MAG TPA: hypothetical protein VFW09_12500 [Solirubrobacteraceae bacterium]|nr:hypothetical protein [Solirubrobacteraceae bacterium]